MRRLLVLLLLLFGLAPAHAAEMVEVEPGIRLHVERIGNGAQIVIVPGGFLYGQEINELARPDRTLVLYDMRNRGRSSRVVEDERITIQADVADLEAVRRHVGAGTASLIGYSYLGLMAMLYAVEHPDRVDRVVQIGPVPIRWDTEFPPDLVWRDPEPIIPAEELAELRRLREDGLIRTDPGGYCLRSERLARLRLVVDPRNAERIDYRARCAMENEWPVNFERHLSLHFGRSIRNFDPPRDAFRAFPKPVLTVHGTMDRNASFAGGVEWATILPQGRLIIAPRAAHQVWLDYPAFFREVDAFLDGDWPGSAVEVRSWDDVRALLPDGLAARQSPAP